MQGNWNQMYGQYPYYDPYQQPYSSYPSQPAGSQAPVSPTYSGANQMPDELPMEQSYIENILRLNRGKVATVYTTFENNEKWNAKVFKGVIEAAGRDHILLSDPQTEKRYLILMVYVDYVTFDEEIEYSYPLHPMETYQPR